MQAASASIFGTPTLDLPRCDTMLLRSLAVALVSAAFAVAQDAQAQLVNLAAASSNGVITLDAKTFDLLTSPKRNWSASVQFTAMDPRRKCTPCK